MSTWKKYSEFDSKIFYFSLQLIWVVDCLSKEALISSTKKGDVVTIGDGSWGISKCKSQTIIY